MLRVIETPLTCAVAQSLRCGEKVLISGEIYTARDAAHKKLAEMAARGETMPFPIEDSIIYYVGPTPAQPGAVIGSAGPTTSGRMDAYSPLLLELGNRGMIGKGGRSASVVEAIRRHQGIYFGAIGGLGALLARCVRSAEAVAFSELGAEAVRRLTVKDFPAVVVIDCAGNNLYEQGRSAYLAFRGLDNQ